MRILTTMLVLALLSCGNRSSDKSHINIASTEDNKQEVINSVKVKSKNKNSETKPTEFYIKDETRYSKTFIKEFKKYHSSYETVSLIDDTIIVNNDRRELIIIPTDLPLKKTVTYEKTEKNKKKSLYITRINISTIEYNYYEIVNWRKENHRQGTADLQPTFYFGAEGTFDDENGITYGMNKYIDNSVKDSWTNIYIGVGNIDKSFLIQGFETDRHKFCTSLLTRIQ